MISINIGVTSCCQLEDYRFRSHKQNSPSSIANVALGYIFPILSLKKPLW